MTTPTDDAAKRVRVKLKHWDRAYTFLVRGEVATPLDGPAIPYDLETLRACAREKGSTWEVLR